jgi:hypothetical protein
LYSRTATYKIDYRNNNLINKPTIPTLPSEITDAQVDSGVGTDEVLMTPTKAKAMIEKHSTGHTPVKVVISVVYFICCSPWYICYRGIKHSNFF